MSIQEYIAVNVFFKNQEAPDYGKNYWEKGGVANRSYDPRNQRPGHI